MLDALVFTGEKGARPRGRAMESSAGRDVMVMFGRVHTGVAYLMVGS